MPKSLHLICLLFFAFDSFEGEISSKNIEIGKIGADKVFRYPVCLTPRIVVAATDV